MKPQSQHFGIHVTWMVLLFGVVYPLSLGPVLWYHKRPSGEGFSRPTKRVLNVVYAPLELVFEYVPLTAWLFERYCVWLWTQWGDQNPSRSASISRAALIPA